jgi:hypothetical protein
MIECILDCWVDVNGRRTRLAVVARQLDAVDICFQDTGISTQHLRYLGC